MASELHQVCSLLHAPAGAAYGNEYQCEADLLYEFVGHVMQPLQSQQQVQL